MHKVKLIKTLAVLISVLVIAGCTKTTITGAVVQSQKNRGLVLVRDFAAEDATDATVSTAIVAAMADTGKGPDTTYDYVRVPPGAVGATFYFPATSTEDDTYTVVLWGCCGDSGPRLPIGYFACTLGTAEHVVLYGDDVSNDFHPDTIAATSYWPTDIDLYTTNGLNQIQAVLFDPLDLTYIWPVVYLANGGVSAGEADTVAVECSFLFNE